MRSNLLVTAFAFLVLLSNPAASQVIAETDCWQTEAGTKAALPALPAGFFAPGSDPVPAQLIDVVGVPLDPVEEANCACPGVPQTDVVFVDIHGDPVPAGSIHAVSQVPLHAPVPDTCVRRLADATFPGGVGVADTIPIEIVELSLTSASPITVTIGGGPTDWQVFITEDGVQPIGQMELTPSVLVPLPAGSLTVPDLPLDFQFRFEPLTFPAGPVFLNGNVNMQNPNPQAPGPPGQFAVLFAPPSVPVLPRGSLLLLGGSLLLLGIVWLRRTRIQATYRAD
ncbi:MAG: hypothetical protein GY725_19095 [bacterium]|nr:hypothetical protein [bacterium]